MNLPHKMEKYFTNNRWKLIALCALILTPALLSTYYTLDTLFMLSGVDCTQFYFATLDSDGFFKSFLLKDSGYLNTVPRFIAAILIYVFHVKIYFAAIYTTLNAAYSCFALSLIFHKKFDSVLGAKIWPRALVLLIVLFFPCSHAIAASYNSSYANVVPILLIFLLLADRSRIFSKVEIGFFLLTLPILVVGKPIYYPLILACFTSLILLSICNKRKRYISLFLSIYALVWYILGLIYILHIAKSFNGSVNVAEDSIKYFPYWIYSAVYFTGTSLLGYWFKIANHLKLYFLVPALSLGLLFFSIGAKCCFDFVRKIIGKNLAQGEIVKFLFYILIVITMFDSVVMFRIVMQNNTKWLLEIVPFSYDRYYWVIMLTTLLQLLFLINYFAEERQKYASIFLKFLLALCTLLSLAFINTDRYLSIASDPVKLLHNGTICDDGKLMAEITDYHAFAQENNNGDRLTQVVEITNQSKVNKIVWSNALACSNNPLNIDGPEKYSLGTYVILGVEKSLKNCSKINATLHAKDGVDIELTKTNSDLSYFDENNVGLVVFAIPEKYRGILAASVASFSIWQECESQTIKGNILFLMPPPAK